MKEKMIDFLLSRASASIRLRVRRDILHELAPAEESTLLADILNEKILQHIAVHQQPNGWIGLGFHGSSKRAGQYDNQETAVKYMGEKGLRGTPLLDGSIDAFTRLMRTDRPEIAQTPVACWVGHAVGPLWYLNEGWSISTGATNLPAPDGVRRVNFEKVEWLCRCGLYPYLPALRAEVEFIAEHIRDGVCRVPFYENEFRGWGPYAGLQLEPDWRKPVRRDCDVTFRALTILQSIE